MYSFISEQFSSPPLSVIKLFTVIGFTCTRISFIFLNVSEHFFVRKNLYHTYRVAASITTNKYLKLYDGISEYTTRSAMNKSPGPFRIIGFLSNVFFATL